MKNISFIIARYLSIALVAVMSFSITHAKDVTSAFSLRAANNVTITKVSSVQSVDNGIHLDLHTHVHRQSASQLLGSAQAERPVSTSRELKKVVIAQEKQATKQPDGLLGHFIPSFTTL